MPHLPAKIRAARAGLGLSQQVLADEAGMHVNTLRGIERGKDAGYALMVQCQMALEVRGVEFLEISGRHGIILPAMAEGMQASAFRAARAAAMMTQHGMAEAVTVNSVTLNRIESDAPSVGDAFKKRYIDGLSRIGIDVFEIDDRLAVLLPPTDGLLSLLRRSTQV